MDSFRYIVEYDEISGTWDVLLDRGHVTYHVASIKDEDTANAVCSCMESLREELHG